MIEYLWDFYLLQNWYFKKLYKPLACLGICKGIVTFLCKYCVFSMYSPINLCFKISRDIISVSVVICFFPSLNEDLIAKSSHLMQDHNILNCRPTEAKDFIPTVRYNQQFLKTGLGHGYGHPTFNYIKKKT